MSKSPADFLPNPNFRAEIADFAELECLRHGGEGISANHVSRVIVRGLPDDREEDLPAPGDIDPDDEDESIFSDNAWTGESRQRARDDRAFSHTWDSFNEARARKDHCGDGVFYPFELVMQGSMIRRRPAKTSRQKWQARLYLFLLLATVATDNKAAGLFEKLCRHVAGNYWGGDARVRALIFGKGRSGGTFKSAVANLSGELGEGGGFAESQDPQSRSMKDGGVDIVVFRRFSDQRAGQLIGFGQCKTGLLRGAKDRPPVSPDAFVKTWLKSGFAVDPVRLFFQAGRIADDSEMRASCAKAGVLFDRCRIMEYAGNLDDGLRREIVAWTRARWKNGGGESLPF